MTRPVNIYTLSRIREEGPFNTVKKHSSGTGSVQWTRYHEMESLRLLSGRLFSCGVTLEQMDGFFYSYHIPHIGKEFDLLRFTEDECLNIELKSSKVPDEQILEQLLKNRHYLEHLGKRLTLFTVVTDTMTCFRLSADGELANADLGEAAQAVKRTAEGYTDSIDTMFRASDYLVSPLETPERFVNGEYFLTQAQEQVKKDLLGGISSAGTGFFHLTGKPGTGKTLLLYDIAKELSRDSSTLMVHCGPLSPEQRLISSAIGLLDIVSADRLTEEDFSAGKYRSILADEAQRMTPAQFSALCSWVKGRVCVFSTDPEQILTSAERKNDIAGMIRRLPCEKEYVLSERIRTNRELAAFIEKLKDLRRKTDYPSSFDDVEINYAATTQEAQAELAYYRARGYTFINYASSSLREDPFAQFEQDFDTHHVIGREFDDVVMLLDSSFRYDEDGVLQGVPARDPDNIYPNLFYQGVSRVREHLALVVVRAPELFGRISSIL